MGCVVAKNSECGELPIVLLPRIPIQLGHKVRKNDELISKLVFIFGGPGSRKGRIVNDLVQGYGFYAINAEKLILVNLQEKIYLESLDGDCTDRKRTTKDVEHLLQKFPHVLTLQWVLNLISNELQKATKEGHQFILIDLVPNLKAMLQIESFIKDCSKEMESFEKEWPTHFALNLAIPEEKLVENLSFAVAKNPSEMLKGGQSDERDILKTKKRFEEYSASVKYFLEYFKESDRLASVDVSCGIADFIWSAVSNLFYNLGFKMQIPINTTIIFAFKNEDVSSVDLQKYRMKLIPLSSLTSMQNINLVELFIAINRYIKQSTGNVESFVIDLKDYSVLERLQQMDKKQIMFVDNEKNQLQQFIYIDTSKQDKCKNLFSSQFKAVSSTENEICLFPDYVDSELCKQVAALYETTKVMLNKQNSNEDNRSL